MIFDLSLMIKISHDVQKCTISLMTGLTGSTGYDLNH